MSIKLFNEHSRLSLALPLPCLQASLESPDLIWCWPMSQCDTPGPGAQGHNCTAPDLVNMVKPWLS